MYQVVFRVSIRPIHLDEVWVDVEDGPPFDLSVLDSQSLQNPYFSEVTIHGANSRTPRLHLERKTALCSPAITKALFHCRIAVHYWHEPTVKLKPQCSESKYLMEVFVSGVQWRPSRREEVGLSAWT